MENLKTLFGDKALTYGELETALSGNKDIKLVDLTEGGYVGKDKYDTLETKYNLASQQLAAVNQKLEGFDPEWKMKAEQAERNANEAVEKVKFDYALNAALSASKARNNTAVRALLNMDGLKLSGNDIVGLKEQIEQIKADNDYLFESDKPTPSWSRPTPGINDMVNITNKRTQANDAIRSMLGNKE